MPKMLTPQAIATRCTQAWLGATLPPSSWNTGALAPMSRNDPLVTTPRQPRPWWIAVLTSPQNAPKPGTGSTSCMTLIEGAGSAAMVSQWAAHMSRTSAGVPEADNPSTHGSTQRTWIAHVHVRQRDVISHPAEHHDIH